MKINNWCVNILSNNDGTLLECETPILMGTKWINLMILQVIFLNVKKLRLIKESYNNNVRDFKVLSIKKRHYIDLIHFSN